MPPETISLMTCSSSPDLKSFEGTVTFGLLPAFVKPGARRTFKFQVTNFRQHNGKVTIKDGDLTVVEVEDALLESPYEESFATDRWQPFSLEQREVIRLLLAGVRQAIDTHWGFSRDTTSRYIHGITREDIASVHFGPFVSA